ncbi:hypothetical protein ACFVH0_00125 [Streptomyces sp. NPDC127117]|uniref:hypothetical protein n=1 Tax=Streptomyces sp. NPDC127117 TaxID=3345368 RepID=UPI00363A9298
MARTGKNALAPAPSPDLTISSKGNPLSMQNWNPARMTSHPDHPCVLPGIPSGLRDVHCLDTMVLPQIADAVKDETETSRRSTNLPDAPYRAAADAINNLATDLPQPPRDEDRTVRLLLAESCDDAPAELLLEVWRWWDGSFSYPGRPRSHPNFPRTGLLRYVGDPVGRMRRLALDDPESTPADVARLARDPEAEARCRAAEDPRLSPADAVRLLNDPADYVRETAIRNPQLPTRVLAGLLHDRATACAAVTNPAIPIPVLHRILAAAAGAA